MKLKSTFTISRSSTGWQRSKSLNPVILIVLLGIILAIAYIVHTLITAQFLSSRGRITVGVYDEIPYVFSYDKKANLGTIVYFDPDILVEVPGGYGWYKLGSVRLLAAIEHKTVGLLEKTFARLVGVPVDTVIYRVSTNIVAQKHQDFMSYFMALRGRQASLAKQYATSEKNLIDRLLIGQVMNISPDRLIAINARNDYINRKGKLYYTEAKLDSHIKGYLYQSILTDSGAKVRIVANDQEYKAATLVERLIEGMGTKVLSIDSDNSRHLTECVITYDTTNRLVAKLLAQYFPCRIELQKGKSSGVIDFYLGTNLATLYL